MAKTATSDAFTRKTASCSGGVRFSRKDHWVGDSLKARIWLGKSNEHEVSSKLELANLGPLSFLIRPQVDILAYRSPSASLSAKWLGAAHGAEDTIPERPGLVGDHHGKS